MRILDSDEMLEILIIITGFLLINLSMGKILGTYFLKWPWFLIPLALALFVSVKYFAEKIPFLGSETYLGQLLTILVATVSYSVFTKSILYYVDAYFVQYAWELLFVGFAFIAYAAVKLKSNRI